MRVSHVITRLIVGGAQENTLASVLGLREKPGVVIKLISGPTHGPEGSLEGELTPHPGLLQIVPELVRPVSPWRDWLALRHLAILFRSQRPQIVHTHSGKAGILGRIAAHRADVPVIIHSIHGPSFGRFQGPVANAAFCAAERYAMKFTTHFVSVADAMSRQYLAAGIGHPEQFTRIFSGFHIEPFVSARNDPAQRERLKIGPGDFVVGKIGRFFRHKGHADLLAVAPELVRRCPHMRFLLVGDGPWRRRFEDQARRLGLERYFIFTGLVRPDEVPGLIGIMDALVHLSVREGLPRAIPQALAAARPVIAYDRDGSSEVCIENETGFLLAPGDSSGLIERLLQLSASPQLCERLGRAGQQLVKKSFPVERMVDELYTLYLRLLAH